MANTFQFPVAGINNVGSYQASGQPYATGGINASTVKQISFPYVTKYFQVINSDASNPLKVGFSLAGVNGSNYFIVAPSASSTIQELKVASIWLSGSLTASIVAGLTGIQEKILSDSANFNNWSGSIGVG